MFLVYFARFLKTKAITAMTTTTTMATTAYVASAGKAKVELIGTSDSSGRLIKIYQLILQLSYSSANGQLR